MNSATITENRYGKVKIETYTPMYEYRGFTIYRGDIPQWKADINYVDAQGNSVNDKKPLFSATIRKNKGASKNLNIHCAQFGGNDGLENEYTDKNWEYTKGQIDKYLEYKREYKITRIKNRMESRHATYICNNVTIRAMFDAGIGGDYTQRNTEIYVNERPLRNAYLNADFTFNDVLEQVYFNTIAKYNVSDYSSQYTKKNFFKNHTTETIDITILPVYELLGKVVKYNEIEFFPYDVNRDRYERKGFTFKVIQSDDVFVPLEVIKTLQITGEATHPIVQLQSLMKYAQFVE